jgi:homoprotocatechuate degradation regulator HpaR
MAKKDVSLPGLLLRARIVVTGKFRKVFREHGLSPEQWRVLHSLTLSDAVEATKLADAVDLLPSSLSRILRDLQERELLLKMSDQNDGRRTLVSITRKGRALVGEVMSDVRVVFADITQKVGRRQIDRLRAELAALIETLSDEDDLEEAESNHSSNGQKRPVRQGARRANANGVQAARARPSVD